MNHASIDFSCHRNLLEALQQARRIPPQPPPCSIHVHPPPHLCPYFALPLNVLQLTPLVHHQQQPSSPFSVEGVKTYPHYQPTFGASENLHHTAVPLSPLHPQLYAPPHPQYQHPSLNQSLFISNSAVSSFSLKPSAKYYNHQGNMLPNISPNPSLLSSPPNLPRNSFLHNRGQMAAPKSVGQQSSLSSIHTPSAYAQPPVSELLRNSFSDIPLDGLEEQLARVSVNDTCVGQIRKRRLRRRDVVSEAKSNEQQTAEEEDNDDDSETEGSHSGEGPLDPFLLVPYSTSSLAFVPPGVIIVSEVWNLFVTEKISLCNGFINSLKFEALKHCTEAHNLNPLGSKYVLRKRLQEFVRRLRESASAGRLTSEEEGESGFRDFPRLDATLGSGGANSNSLMAKLAQPVVLTPDSFYDFLLFIDLEATCERRQKTDECEYPHEIIEFPVLLYDTRLRKCIGVFHSYCRPVHRPELTAFCKDLTQIRQSQVDKAVDFPKLLRQLEQWLLVQNNLGEKRCAIVCDCSADMGKFMRKQCQLSQLRVPEWASLWINLSHAFHAFYRLPPHHKSTLTTMLDDLDLCFVGQHHSGLDDALNILRVAQIMLADGCQLRVNQRLDSGRPPSYSATVPRAAATSANGGIMGSRLELLKPKRARSTNNASIRHDYTPHSGTPPSTSGSCHSMPQGGPHEPKSSQSSASQEADELLLRLHRIQKNRVYGPQF